MTVSDWIATVLFWFVIGVFAWLLVELIRNA
jgi:hypothetical protein